MLLIAFFTLGFECPTLATKIVEVKSIQQFPSLSQTWKFFALSHTTGNCPCMDLTSYFFKLLIRFIALELGILVTILLNFVLIILIIMTLYFCNLILGFCIKDALFFYYEL